MLLKLTLEQNRSNPRRYTRIVKYVRQGGRMIPYLVTRSSVTRLEWPAIKPEPVEEEFEQLWAAHVLMERHKDTLARLAS